MQALQSLQQKCGAWQVVAHAKALESEEKLADGVRDMQLAEDGTAQSKGTKLSILSFATRICGIQSVWDGSDLHKGHSW